MAQLLKSLFGVGGVDATTVGFDRLCSQVADATRIILGGRGGSIGKASDLRSKVPRFEPHQEHKKTKVTFF